MAFTEASLVAQLDSASTGKLINVERYIPGSVYTDVYAIGLNGYAGRSRWVQVDSTLTAAQAATAIRTGLS